MEGHPFTFSCQVFLKVAVRGGGFSDLLHLYQVNILRVGCGT